MTSSTVKERLVAHLAGDGTLNDNTVDALYREANRVPDDQETELEVVERWAVSLAGPARGQIGLSVKPGPILRR